MISISSVVIISIAATIPIPITRASDSGSRGLDTHRHLYIALTHIRRYTDTTKDAYIHGSERERERESEREGRLYAIVKSI